jgi:hypothetical protein
VLHTEISHHDAFDAGPGPIRGRFEAVPREYSSALRRQRAMSASIRHPDS